MLHGTELVPSAIPLVRQGESPEAQARRAQFLVAFVRALLRMNPNEDLVLLAMRAAVNESGATREDAELLLQSILVEVARSPWPKDFF